MATKLYDLAKVLRSKNSGPFEITLDIIFSNKDDYERVKNSEIINKKLISELYNVSMDDISVLVNYDQAYAIKITYGAQQHAPLMNIIIP